MHLSTIGNIDWAMMSEVKLNRHEMCKHYRKLMIFFNIIWTLESNAINRRTFLEIFDFIEDQHTSRVLVEYTSRVPSMVLG
jgi:hypothetical protein